MQTLYEGTSEYYTKYRPDYPAAMFDDIISKFYLNGTGRLLDIGCGPGVLAIPLSEHVKEVLAVDIDPGMIKVGQERAEKLGIKNITWLNKSADDLDSTIGTFDLITLGASFHLAESGQIFQAGFQALVR